VVAFGEQGLANLGVLKNFAVKGDPDASIFVGDGLVTASEVD
jgi:hypothetical protein